MRKLHIQSESIDKFFDNLKELMISHGLSNLSVETDAFTGLFPDLSGMFKPDSIFIKDYYSVENCQALLLETQNRKHLIIYDDELKVTPVSKSSSHFDHLKLINSVLNTPESVNFIET